MDELDWYSRQERLAQKKFRELSDHLVKDEETENIKSISEMVAHVHSLTDINSHSKVELLKSLANLKDVEIKLHDWKTNKEFNTKLGNIHHKHFKKAIKSNFNSSVTPEIIEELKNTFNNFDLFDDQYKELKDVSSEIAVNKWITMGMMENYTAGVDPIYESATTNTGKLVIGTNSDGNPIYLNQKPKKEFNWDALGTPAIGVELDNSHKAFHGNQKRVFLSKFSHGILYKAYALTVKNPRPVETISRVELVNLLVNRSYDQLTNLFASILEDEQREIERYNKAVELKSFLNSLDDEILEIIGDVEQPHFPNILTDSKKQILNYLINYKSVNEIKGVFKYIYKDHECFVITKERFLRRRTDDEILLISNMVGNDVLPNDQIQDVREDLSLIDFDKILNVYAQLNNIYIPKE